MQLRFHPIKPLLLLWIWSIWRPIWQRAIGCDDDGRCRIIAEYRAEFQRLFPAMHAQEMLALTALTTTVNSLPFLACHSAVFLSREYKLCQTEAQPNTIIYWEERLHPGKSAPRPMTIAVGSLSSVPTNGKPILTRCLAWAWNEC